MSDLQTNGTSGGLDDRGFETQTVRHSPVTEANLRTVGAATYLGLPQKPGGRRWNQLPTGDYEVFIAYEGHTGSGEQMDEKFAWLTSSTDEPIESHPEINRFLSEYGGWIDGEGKAKWPPFQPSPAAAATSLIASVVPGFGLAASAISLAEGALGESKPNPMFGTEIYTVRHRVLKHTFASRRYPKKIAEMDGKVVKSLPSGAPGGRRAKRDYMVIVPTLEQRGTGTTAAYDVEVHYIESEEGGWPPVYQVLS